VARAEALGQEIRRLKEAIDVGRKTNSLRFDFVDWAVWYGSDGKNLQRACSADILQELGPRFREAFVLIVEERLEERQKELEAVCV